MYWVSVIVTAAYYWYGYNAQIYFLWKKYILNRNWKKNFFNKIHLIFYLVILTGLKYNNFFISIYCNNIVQNAYVINKYIYTVLAEFYSVFLGVFQLKIVETPVNVRGKQPS